MTRNIRERIIRGSRRSPRVVYFATKVTPEFDALLRQEAHKEGYSLAEMLEKYQEIYEERKGIKKQKPEKEEK